MFCCLETMEGGVLPTGLDTRAYCLVVFAVQQLCGQIVALRKGLDDAIAKGRSAILDLDTTHQHVHILQTLTESELREQISVGPADEERVGEKYGDGMAVLHKQVCLCVRAYMCVRGCEKGFSLGGCGGAEGHDYGYDMAVGQKQSCVSE